MRLGLVVLLSLAGCAAQTPEKETDAYYPAPYFNEEENLSSQNCGNNKTALYQNKWIVYVRNIRNQERCSFIAISQRTILKQDRFCSYDKKDTTDLRVFPRICLFRETEEECIRVSIKVLDVIKIAINPDAHYKFTILITEKMRSVEIPFCLFNRDNAMDSQLQRESTYFQWSKWPMHLRPIPKRQKRA